MYISPTYMPGLEVVVAKLRVRGEIYDEGVSFSGLLCKPKIKRLSLLADL